MDAQNELKLGLSAENAAHQRWQADRCRRLRELAGRAIAAASPDSGPPARVAEADLLDSAAHGDTHGLSSWYQAREESLRDLARETNLPLGHSVELWLRDGVRLRGVLRLKGDEIFLPTTVPADFELHIGRATFTRAEIDCWVRLD